MEIYSAIPAQFKPPRGSAQLQYAEAFDGEFTLLLCERKSDSVDDMKNDVMEVEVKLTSAMRKKRDECEWRREEGDQRKGKEPEQPSMSYTQETNMDVMMNTMENLMERLTVDNRPPPKYHQEQQNRNQNVRRPQILQNRLRDQINIPEQLVRPPLKENYVRHNYDDQVEDEIHHLDVELSPSFLTREDNDGLGQETKSLQVAKAEGI